MSWVLEKGPYHPSCSPIGEDATYKQAAMIPLDKTAQSLNEAPLPPVKISMAKRALIVASALWLLLVFVVALNESRDDAAKLFTLLTVLGIIPVGLIWGAMWVYSARRRG